LEIPVRLASSLTPKRVISVEADFPSKTGKFSGVYVAERSRNLALYTVTPARSKPGQPGFWSIGRSMLAVSRTGSADQRYLRFASDSDKNFVSSSPVTTVVRAAILQSNFGALSVLASRGQPDQVLDDFPWTAKKPHSHGALMIWLSNQLPQGETFLQFGTMSLSVCTPLSPYVRVIIRLAISSQAEPFST